MADVDRSEQLRLTGDDLAYLSEVVSEQASPRKKRLFGCACVRRYWPCLTDPRICTLIEVLEAYADRSVKREQLRAALLAAEAVVDEARIRVSKDVWLSTCVPGWAEDEDGGEQWIRWNADSHPDVVPSREVVRFAGIKRFDGIPVHQLVNTRGWFPHRPTARDCEEELAEPRAILRDIFGNPFRPAACDPAWRTDTAVSLARQMYESRDFSLMPILADALQDAGCEHADVLDHCRDPNGTHVRGCWVVDLVLGKQ